MRPDDPHFGGAERGARLVIVGSVLAVALAFLTPAVWLAARSTARVLGWTRAPGVVERIEDDRDVVVRFETREGTRQRFVQPYQTDVVTFEPGQHVSVLYDPLDPRQAQIDAWALLWLGPLAIGVFGALPAGGAVLAWRLMAR